jgi:hypothetical protein
VRPGRGAAIRPYFEECPLLIHTGSGAWRSSSVDDGVLFDLDGDGVQERTAWTEPDSGIAILALDLDGDGAISGAQELFGAHMALAGAELTNGFDALAFFDDDANGTVDAHDGVWPDLLLWTDRNHDGRSETSELRAVASTDIVAIETRFTESRRTDVNGNSFRYRALLRRASGAVEPYYDVYFRARPND